MTIKLYDMTPYETEFTANVIECTEEKGLYRILLDQTLFFPEEGGQTCDRGTLGGQEVLDVKIKGDEIYHYVKKQMNHGDGVRGSIDFEHRFRNMQLHSGEHIFSGLVDKLYGYSNVGFHLSDNDAHMDYDGKFSKEDIDKLEELANQVIVSNVEIKTFYPSKEELASIDYRSKKELLGAVRIVEIPGTDICACCAPHVKRTGEIGIFKVTGFENYKGGTRVYYLCGFRAIKDYGKRIDQLKEISQVLSAKTYEEDTKVKELFEKNRETEFELVSVKNKLIETEIKHGFNGEKNGYIVLPLKDAVYMRFAMASLHKYYSKRCIVLCGDEENGYRYLIESDGEDLSMISDTLKKNLSAKGGGRADSIQGSVSCKINNILEIVL